MALFRDDWMEELLAKNDIVSVVSSYVHLKAKGRNLWGVCPFHQEKTPSFSVAPEKQMFYCFGCHAGGGAVQFIMQAERLSYVEAVKFLAQRAGMELPDQVDDRALQQEREKKRRLYEACRDAARFYFDCLRSDAGKEARAYFARRGLDGAMVSRFGLGYAPDSWDSLKNAMLEKGHTQEDLIAAGLLLRKGERVYDAYRNRVIFPIIATTGNVLGFGARAMDGAEPKYINTGETVIYNKRANLYGLNVVKKKKQLSDIVMVEGYMDVISLHMAGVDNAVASLGTALTQQQARLLKRYVSTVYISYDGDSAGQNATMRGLDILAAEGLQVRVIVLPEGQDPDDFIRSQGKEAFDQLRDRALALNEFKLRHMQKQYDLTDANERERFAVAACRFIATLQPLEQDRYYEQLARSTGFRLESLKAQGERAPQKGAEKPLLRPAAKAEPAQPQPERQWTENIRAQWSFLKLLLQAPQTAMEAMEPYGLDLFSDPAFRDLAVTILTACSVQEKPDIPLLASSLEGEAAQLFSRMTAELTELPANVRRYADDCIRTIRRAVLREQIQLLQEKAAQIGTEKEEKLALVEKIQKYSAMLKEL